MADHLDDVADSTDWLSTPLSGLCAVEAALRCQVCKDFYKTPMLTSCNHTFCSVCIRRALSNDGRCPLCRASEQELKLRSNWSMEETVEAFVKTRRDVLEFARAPPQAAAPTAIAATPESPKRKRGDPTNEDHETPGSSQRSNKRLRSSARLSKSRSADAMTEMARQEAEVIEDDQDKLGDYEPDDGLVACPMCQRRMKENLVFPHLDTCPGEPQAKPSPSRSNSRPSAFAPKAKPTPLPPPPPPSKPLERLPAIHYSMLKEPQLRKKLQDLGISTAGSRQMLERRHKEWMTIWNANCDSLHPRRKAELLHDLDVWERTLGTRAPTSSRSIKLGTEIKDKDFDGAAWATKHDTSFKSLIASARKNRVKVQEATNGSENGGKAEAGTRSGPKDSEEAAKRGDEPADVPPETWTDGPGPDAADAVEDAAMIDLTGDSAAKPPDSIPSAVTPRRKIRVTPVNGYHAP